VGGGSGSPRLWRSWQRSCPCRAATAPAGGGGTGGQHGGAALALGAVAPAGVCAGDGPRPVVPARGVAAPCPHHAGRGAQPEPPPSATCCRPIPHRACPCSPRNVRLGGLNPRRRAWSHQRRAGSGGVSPTSPCHARSGHLHCTIHYYPLCLHENNTLYIFLRSLLWCTEAHVPMRPCTTARRASQQH
jgi:hypothetical protein